VRVWQAAFALCARFRPYLRDKYNHELVEIHRIGNGLTEEFAPDLRSVIEEYVRKTDKRWGHEILENFLMTYIGKFC